jgi:hypothetical protein
MAVASHPQSHAGALDSRDRAVIDFERSWWTRPGSKADGIRDQLDLSPSQYRRILQTLLDDPVAAEYDPLTIRRLRHRREVRRREHIGGRRADPRLP